MNNDEGQPPQELVLEAIDVARWVPNHHLTESWRFLLYEHCKNTIVDLNTELVAGKKDLEAGKVKDNAGLQSRVGWL